MKKYQGVDYSYQPESYWEDTTVLQALLRDVKGTQRRKMIIDYFESDALDQLGESFLQSTLSEDQRKRLGLIHPLFMGGEYLPDCGLGETEIARVELQSTLADVISIRAIRCEGGYDYSVVDEHENTFRLQTESSIDPLTLEELIYFIDGTEEQGGWAGGLALSYNIANAESLPRKRLRFFTRIHSEIYPQLETHYENVFSDWVYETEEEEVETEAL